MKSYTIVLADDHTLMREGIKNIVNAVDGLTIIGEAGDGIEVLNLLRKIRPDMLILDISMPGMRGIEVAHEIRNNYPDIRVLFLSMHKSAELLEMAVDAGVKGYVLKEDSSAELLLAIDQIRHGKTYLSKRLLPVVPADIIDICSGSKSAQSELLTQRECQVLKLVAEGKTSEQIGCILYISTRTAHRHRDNIKKKLNLKSTADVVQYAISKGYLSVCVEGAIELG